MKQEMQFNFASSGYDNKETKKKSGKQKKKKKRKR
tara:strand:- start:72 stop:176 length:105 start_codon:yes stop_codon:yes gene_type:complete